MSILEGIKANNLKGIEKPKFIIKSRSTAKENKELPDYLD